MDLSQKASIEIRDSLPFFHLLIIKKSSKRLRRVLIQEAPDTFFDTITQIARHYLNGSFCRRDRNFCTRFRKPLLILSDPSTKLFEKKLILEFEPPIFIKELFTIFEKHLQNDTG